MRLVELDGKQLFDQCGVADLVAHATQGGGNLSVEQWRGKNAKALVKNFKILSGGMDYLDSLRVAEQRGQRLQVMNGDGVDAGMCAGMGQLHQAKLWAVGALAQELGVDGQRR